VRAADLDGVTIDAYGTLVTLVDPVPALTAALAERNAARDRETVVHGFRTEVAYYAQHSAEGHDEASLALLQRECAHVFLQGVDADIDPAEFASAFAAAMHFEPIPGVLPALERLRRLGLELAVVANWDLTLHRLLDEVGISRQLRAVVHAAAKPAPGGLLRALEQMNVSPGRALHVGDDEADELAARAAGMHFAPAPLAEAVAWLA
jgi:putative hydrolase of the HAD superfamily